MDVCYIVFSSVQFSHSVVSDLLWSHELQDIRPPCPSPAPGVHPNPHPSSQWCHPTISSSVIPFSSCLQSFPASGSFPMSQLFASGGRSIGFSASASVLPVNTQDCSPLGWTIWISLKSKGLSRVFSNTTVQKHQFFGAQLYSQSNSHIHTWPLEKPYPYIEQSRKISLRDWLLNWDFDHKGSVLRDQGLFLKQQEWSGSLGRRISIDRIE